MNERLISSLLFSAVVPALAMVQAANAQTATIEGNISDASGPVDGAIVAISDPFSGGHPLATGGTDAAGDYSISIAVAPGAGLNVVVEAASPDHAPARHDHAGELPCFFNCGGPGGEFSVSEGETVDNIDIVLEAGGTIAGTITDADSGNPLPGAYIELFLDNGLHPFSYHFSGEANASGDYATPLAVREGDYFMLAHAASGDNYVTQAWNGIACQHGAGCPLTDTDPVTVEAGTGHTGFDFALRPGATIQGTLQPDDIVRVIRLFDGSGAMLEQLALFDPMLPEANWSFDRLSGGSYYVELGALTGLPYVRVLHNGLLCPFGGCDRARGVPITIPPSSTLSLAEITLEEGGQIEGTVVDTATGSTPGGVPAGAQLGSYDIITAGGEVVGGGRITEDAGQVVLQRSSGVPPGSYYVRTFSQWLGDGIGFSPDQTHESITGYADAAYPDIPCAGRRCDLGAAATVTVVAGGVASIEIGITAGSNISGTVVDRDGGSGVENVVVKLVDASNATLAATLTDEEGDYLFGAFPAGDYYVRTATAGRYGEGHFGVQNAYFDKLHGAPGNCSELLCDPAAGAVVTLDGTTDETLPDLEIESGPVIFGQIIDSLTGLPINRGHVEVYNAGAELVGEYRLATHRDAYYRTTALSPGDYTLVPVVSPAFAGATASSPSADARSIAGRGDGNRSRGVEGIVVSVGSEDVEVNLAVVDQGLNSIFQDEFIEQ